MKALVREAMRDGAVGVSTSLQYAPAPYAKTEELIALAAEAAKLGGIYASHIRDEGNGIDAALDEAFRIGREAKIPVEIWHLKAAGKSNWGRMPEIVARIDAARKSGVDVAADTYAYTAGVQFLFGDHSAVGARWRRQEADRAAEGSGHARAHPQGNGNAVRRLEQRVAAGDRAGVIPDRRGAESEAAAAPGQDASPRSPNSGTRIRSTRSSTC